MDTADIETKVIQFIATKAENLDASTINRSSKFEELGLDSMDTIQLLFDAEDALESISTVKKQRDLAALEILFPISKNIRRRRFKGAAPSYA